MTINLIKDLEVRKQVSFRFKLFTAKMSYSRPFSKRIKMQVSFTPSRWNMSQMLFTHVIRNLDISEHRKAHYFLTHRTQGNWFRDLKEQNHTQKDGFEAKYVCMVTQLFCMSVLRVLIDVIKLLVHNYFDIREIYAFFCISTLLIRNWQATENTK